MTRTVTARLTTLCGARQYVCMDGPAPPEYLAPIKADEGGSFYYRRFLLVSLLPTDAAVDAEYIEEA